jgi:hypothetical protein
MPMEYGSDFMAFRWDFGPGYDETEKSRQRDGTAGVSPRPLSAPMQTLFGRFGRSESADSESRLGRDQ